MPHCDTFRFVYDFVCTWAPYAIGYAFAVVPGALWPVARPIWQLYGRDRAEKKDHHDPFIGRLMGQVERPLYVAAFLANEPTFVGIWLGLKTAGGWKRWQDEIKLKDGGGAISGRTVFNVMLIGSAVLVAYGWVGAYIVRTLEHHNWQSAVVVSVALLLAHLCLYGWLRGKVPAEGSRNP